LLPLNSCVYNLDTVRDIALIVEGAFDVWRFGDGTIGTWGSVFTEEQITEIKDREIKKAVIMYDGEPQAIRQAYKLANKLSVFIPVTEVIELEKGDPDDLPPETIKQILEEVFGY
jgi:DNA primase